MASSNYGKDVFVGERANEKKVKQGSHGHTVCPTRFANHVFEVMLDRVNRVFGCRARSSNGSTNLTLVGGASLSNVWFECVNSRQTSNLSCALCFQRTRGNICI